MFRSLHRRDIVLLMTFWIASMGLIGLGLGFLLLRASAAAPAHAPTYVFNPSQVTAKSLYPLAREAALAWEDDVQFVSASATWNQPALADLEQPVDWLYRFYSPKQRRLLFVIVAPDQTVMARPHLAKTWRELRLIDPDQWSVDSPASIANWLNQGGGGLWLDQTASRAVSAQLTFNISENKAVWTISGSNQETGQSVNYTLPASSP